MSETNEEIVRNLKAEFYDTFRQKEMAEKRLRDIQKAIIEGEKRIREGDPPPGGIRQMNLNELH